MFIAMNKFQVVPERENDFETIWKERDSYLQEVPGFVQFALLRGEEDGDRVALFRNQSGSRRGVRIPR